MYVELFEFISLGELTYTDAEYCMLRSEAGARIPDNIDAALVLRCSMVSANKTSYPAVP